MRIDAEEGPTGEARVHRPHKPRHGFLGVTQEGVNAGDLVVGVGLFPVNPASGEYKTGSPMST